MPKIRFPVEFWVWLGVIVLTWAIFFASRANGQTITCVCPSMPIIKQGVGHWQAQKIVSVAVVKLPPVKVRIDDLMPGPFGHGFRYKTIQETLTFKDFTIAATPVRGVLRRAVDPCEITGIATEDGSVMTLQLPREPVVVGFRPLHPFRPTVVAVAITARGTLTRPGGGVHLVALNYPDCPTSRLGRGVRLAAALTAYGTVGEVMLP